MTALQQKLAKYIQATNNNKYIKKQKRIQTKPKNITHTIPLKKTSNNTSITNKMKSNTPRQQFNTNHVTNHTIHALQTNTKTMATIKQQTINPTMQALQTKLKTILTGTN